MDDNKRDEKIDQDVSVELTLKDLQIEVIKLGMPEEDAKKFTNKTSLQATINVLKAVKTVAKVDSLNMHESPKITKEDNEVWLSKAERMRAHLDKQPKIRILIPLDLGGQEKVGVVREVMIRGRKEYIHVSGAIETVTLNGCKTIIPKGVYFYVPEQVADVLDESNRATQEAGKDILADRIDPDTGRPILDRL